MIGILAKILGVRGDQVDDALIDQARAQKQLSRRGFLLATGVLAVEPLLPTRVWSFPAEDMRRIHRFLFLYCPDPITYVYNIPPLWRFETKLGDCL